jgi:hypothetical protein
MADCKIIFVIIILYFLYLCFNKQEFFAFGPRLVPRIKRSQTDWGPLNDLTPTYLSSSEILEADFPDIVGSYDKYY